jgi:hypothetical protein
MKSARNHAVQNAGPVGFSFVIKIRLSMDKTNLHYFKTDVEVNGAQRHH